MLTITTKDEFLERSRRGLLGNHPHYWNSTAEARADGHTDDVAIRYRQPDSPFMRYHVPLDQVESVIEEFRQQGADPAKFYLNEQEFSVPRILQGECCRTTNGLYLNYSRSQGGLRTALTTDGRHAYGLAAKLIIQAHFDPSSYDDLMDFLDTYPGCAVEFTAFERPTGAFAASGRRVIFWEVRNY